MPRKTDPKRLEWNKKWLAKKKLEDPQWAAKRRRRQTKRQHEKLAANPELAAKERERQRRVKQDQRADPIRGDRLRESETSRHRRRYDTDPEYRAKKLQTSFDKYYRDKDLDPNAIRDRSFKSRCKSYGITVEEYEQMFEEQGGVCKICECPESNEYKGTVTMLAIDHCHKTGKVRGLLCAACNTGIGRLDDNVEKLQAAIEYLK